MAACVPCPIPSDKRDYCDDEVGTGPFRAFYARYYDTRYRGFSSRTRAENFLRDGTDSGELFAVCLQDTRSGAVLWDGVDGFEPDD